MCQRVLDVVTNALLCWMRRKSQQSVEKPKTPMQRRNGARLLQSGALRALQLFDEVDRMLKEHSKRMELFAKMDRETRRIKG